MIKPIFFSTLLMILHFGCASHSPTSWSVLNPNNTLAFHLYLQDSTLFYSVSFNKTETIPVLDTSPLGIKRQDQDFTKGLSFVSQSRPKTISETYHMLTGKQSTISYNATEQSFLFENAQKQKLEILVRAFADGVAFRYGFPETLDKNLLLTADLTGFNLPDSGEAWILPYSQVDTWAPAYETEWKNAIPIGTPAPEAVGWSFPALFHANDLWIMLTEAGLDTTSFGLHLEQNAVDGLYRVRLPEEPETYGVAPQEATIQLPWSSSWRTIVVGADPGTILETNIVTHLSAPNALKDTSWIKPGRVSWSWWSEPSSPNQYDRLLPFIDLSAQLGWEYSLIDLGWHEMNHGGDIQDLIAYADSKGVGLILWYNSGGPHNQVPDACPCDIMDDPVKRRAEMQKLQEWGVKGIKVDFMQSDKQYVIQLYHDILLDAADYHLLVDFHGATIPRGWQRTYPNLMTMEGIRGAEQYWDVNFAENAHTFHTIYTFTRNVVGSMDYTPVIFGDAENKIPHQTTNAHELATAVAFESGLQHFADNAQNYLAQPDYVLDFLSTVPVAWDETQYIEGIPGKWVVMARRKKQDWYIVGLNGGLESRTISIPLSFLQANDYDCLLITDGDKQRAFTGDRLTVNKDDTLSLIMAGRGGFSARCMPN